MKIIDLFAGIGGFHLAFHKLGASCVFASEINHFARKTYLANFQNISPDLFQNNNFNENILKAKIEAIPKFDILCAGFPCQPFSQAGYKKGFNDEKENRGNMFFIIRDIIEKHRPKAIFLENVRHLVKHDNGRTFEIIKNIIKYELGYDFYWSIANASDFGLPQHRPRVYMVGINRELGFKQPFSFPAKQPLKLNMSNILGGRCEKEIGFTLRVGGRGSKINDKRNWEHYIVDDNIVRINLQHGKKMMGYPDDFIFPVSESQAMKQLGNSVAVDAIYEIGKNLINYLEKKPLVTNNHLQNYNNFHQECLI
jgi:DNA (cytosine-5)-methyltransferase 1